MNTVMWQIRRIRLDRVGAAASRFLDVTIDLSDDDGFPLDSILWLRNGGGKSTVLSLICALIRPHRRDFLATSATDKHLEDYILGPDTAHITIEWSGPAGRRLVSGAVHEWTDRTQPADPNRDHDKLQSRWYAFTPVPGRAELELLPFSNPDGQPLPLKEFTAALRGWDSIPGCGATVTDGQDRWARVLDDHGLDPDLFTAILQMNATEGGIEGQFQFRNPDAFVRYLLELIVDPEVPRSVSQILESVRAGLAERPAILADLTFAGEAVPRLHRLADARTDHTESARTLTDAHVTATGLRLQLLAAVKRAEAERDAAATIEETQRDRVAVERREREAAYNRSVEFRRIAAAYRKDAAVARHQDLDRQRQARQSELEAWQAVPRLHALSAARLRVRELEAQLRAATADAEPLRQARDDAAATLATALDSAISELTDQAEIARRRRDQHNSDAMEAKKLRGDRTSERGHKQARLQSLIEILGLLDSDVAAAVAAGHVSVGEDVAAAAARHRHDEASAKQRLATIGDERRDVRGRRDALAVSERDLGTARSGVAHDRQSAVERREALVTRIEMLAAEERLRMLAEADDVDVLAEANDLAALLTEHIARADRRRIEIAVAGSEDDRAADALGSTGLLPPVLDIALALAECDKAGIAVTSGWAYLADSVPSPLRYRVLQAAPALSGGVLVHDPADLPAAQQLLTTAVLRPTSPVAVATTADLHTVVEQVAAGTAPATFVVPTAPALTDKAAAGEELRLRELARGERAEEAAALDYRRNADDEIRRSLRDLLAECPPGTLNALDDAIGRFDRRLADLDEELADIPTQRGELDAEAEALDEQERAAQTTRVRAASAMATLAALQPRLAAAEEQRREATLLPAQIEALSEAIDAADAAETAALNDAQAADDDWRTRSGLAGTYRTERAGLGDDLPAGGAPVSLGSAREEWRIADAAYRRETSESALAAVVDEAKRAVIAPADEVARLPEPRRRRAEQLAATAEGTDTQLTMQATRDVGAEVTRLTDGVNDAVVEVQLAEKEVRHLTPPDRLHHAQLDPAEIPPTREAALEAAAAAETARDEHLAAENEAQMLMAAAGADRTEADGRADAMRNTALLLGGARDDTVGDDVDAYAGPVEQAQIDVDRLRGELQAAQQMEVQLRDALTNVSTELALWANEDRFLQVKSEVRARFRVSNAAEELGTVATGLADDLDVYAANLRARLGELEQHKSVVVTAMTGMVRQALKAIERAQRLSELPESLGEWARQRFLEVAPRASVDTSEAIVRDRCSRLVDSLTSRGVEVPRDLELLWQATSAVVGDGNWRARVLKPTTTVVLDRVPVEKMRKWSGGEKVTISLLLFCMVAKLRAQNRGRDLPGLGVLPLDNPLGKANYVVFLDLQRKVAAANGVQLLFLTGVGDMKAVGRFPNIVRMRNTANRSREYVRVAERMVPAEDPAGVVDSTRVWRDDPVQALF